MARDMYPLFSVLFWLILGRICSYVAKQRGRSPVAWFIIGIFLGVIGLILLYVLPPKKALESFPPLVNSATQGTESEVTINPNIAPSSNLATSATHQKLWYYLDQENNRYGPMSFEALKRAWIDDQLDNETYVWNEDMSDWKLLAELTDILARFHGSVPESHSLNETS